MRIRVRMIRTVGEMRGGDEFAGYRIERVLGRGGMGTVYLAQHPRLPRSTALKLLNRDMFAHDDVRARFEREADLAARLDHPNIVAVYDRGVEADQLWISMQYIDGSDASRLGAVEPTRAARIIAETAEALDFAHHRGVLHRDIKPANILIAPGAAGRPERILLADFGIARLRDDANQLTQTGTFTATLAFASPEQLSGAALDHLSDQYSLACTLFVLLTGRSPFSAFNNPVAMINAHLQSPPPPVSAYGLSPALDQVLARALAKRPDDRFASCGEFAAAVHRALAAPATTVAATPRSALASSTVRQHGGYVAPAHPHSSPHASRRSRAHYSHSASAGAGPLEASPIMPQLSRPHATGRSATSAAWLLVAIAAICVIVLAVGGTLVAFNWDKLNPDPKSSWERWTPGEQIIVDAFPRLLPETKDWQDRAWNQTTCTKDLSGMSSYRPDPIAFVSCFPDGQGVSFSVVDFGSRDVVAQIIPQMVAVSDPVPPTRTRRTHKNVSGDVEIIVPQDGIVAELNAVYVAFPDEPARSRFLIGIAWPDHSVEQILLNWLDSAPLGT